VVEHRGPCLFGVLRLDGARDLREGGWDGARVARVGIAERWGLPYARLVETERDADPQPVLGRARQGLVPACICLRQRRPVVGDLLQQPARLGDEQLERCDIVGIGASRRPPSGVGLEGEPELRELLSVRSLEADERRKRGAERRFGGARGVGTAGAPRADLDDSERFEGAERLADGWSSDLESPGEIALVRQAASLRDLAGEDRISDLEEDVVERAETPGWRERHGITIYGINRVGRMSVDGISTIRYLTTVSFGFGASALLGDALAELGIARPLVVTDSGVRAAGIADEVVGALREPGRATWFDRTPPNPTEAAVLEATETFRAAECDGIVAIGGGSSIDLAKGVALVATHPGPLVDYAAVNGGVERITSRVARTIAIPTTAGTGSEVGRAAMINVQARKLDFISPHLFPARALCDPRLTLELPPYLAAPTGMDALTHCVETYLSPLVNPPADAIALDGFERAARWIEEATSNGRSREARWNMMMASTEGALTFQKGLGAVHAMAHPLGALENLPLHHGTLNAVLLPAVLRFNEPAAPEKYDRLRRVVDSADLAAWVVDLNARLALPPGLAAMGVPPDVLSRVAGHAEQDPATETNARPATRADYEELLRSSIGT